MALFVGRLCDLSSEGGTKTRSVVVLPGAKLANDMIVIPVTMDFQLLLH
jgi:hypothetical protein